MRSTYETLIDRFSENTIEDMLIELHANAIHNVPVSKSGPLQLFRDKLEQDGFPDYNVARLAESALRDYALIKHVENYKRTRRYPLEDFQITSMTIQVNDEEMRKLINPKNNISIGYRVEDNFTDHHNDALKYKKED